jgi:hypothetical protein
LRDAETVGLGIESCRAWPVLGTPGWWPPVCLHSLSHYPIKHWLAKYQHTVPKKAKY